MTEVSLSDVSNLTFEKALAELEAIVGKLERGDVPLEESIAMYSRGEVLRTHCETLLKQAEMRIEKIALGADSSPKGVVPLDPQ